MCFDRGMFSAIASRHMQRIKLFYHQRAEKQGMESDPFEVLDWTIADP